MDPTTENINFFVSVLTENDFSASEIHQLLLNACGEIKSLRRIQDIRKQYRKNERKGNSRIKGSGRLRTETCDDNATKVKQLLDEDCTLSIRGISALTDLSIGSVYRIITEKLLMKCVHARWVPHRLTEDHKVQRVKLAQKLLRNLNIYTVVIDEKWIYSDHLPSRQDNSFWVAADGDRPTIARRTISDMKFHIIVACNFVGDFRFQVLQRNQSINAERYADFLQTILNMKRIGHLDLMHDNARPHVAVKTQAFCEEHGIKILRQPPYSPDMNLLDRFVFRNLEFDRRKTRFPNINAISEYLQNFMKTKMTKLKLTKEFEQLKNHLHDVIKNHGDYM